MAPPPTIRTALSKPSRAAVLRVFTLIMDSLLMATNEHE
jgi:hypothetical protein